MAIIIARPKMKPVITGLEKNSDMKPSRSSLATRKSNPTMIARPDASTMYSADPATARPPRIAAIMTAIVEVVVVITWRDVLNMAYPIIAAGAV